MPNGDNIQFNDGTEEFGAAPSRQNPSGTDLTGKLISWGLAKDRQQAQTIMIVVVVIALAIAAYFMFFGGGGSSVPSTPNFGA